MLLRKAIVAKMKWREYLNDTGECLLHSTPLPTIRQRYVQHCNVTYITHIVGNCNAMLKMLHDLLCEWVCDHRSIRRVHSERIIRHDILIGVGTRERELHSIGHDDSGCA